MHPLLNKHSPTGKLLLRIPLHRISSEGTAVSGKVPHLLWHVAHQPLVARVIAMENDFEENCLLMNGCAAFLFHAHTLQ